MPIKRLDLICSNILNFCGQQRALCDGCKKNEKKQVCEMKSITENPFSERNMLSYLHVRASACMKYIWKEYDFWLMIQIDTDEIHHVFYAFIWALFGCFLSRRVFVCVCVCWAKPNLTSVRQLFNGSIFYIVIFIRLKSIILLTAALHVKWQSI